MKIPNNVMEAINEMFYCETMIEHFACYQRYYRDLTDCNFIVFSEYEGTELPKALCTNYENDFAVINIGCANRYYAMNKEIYEEMLKTRKSEYYIDVCVELDTQAVSYLKDIFVEYNEMPVLRGRKCLIEYLQLPNVDYSCNPYLVENAAKMNSINSIDCYNNIKSFMLFKAFDHTGFLQNGVIKYNVTEEEIQIETDILFNDIRSEKFIEYYIDIYEMQKAAYILLLKAISIEFINSKRSAQNKIMDLFDFVNNELGFIAERELEVCYYYFMHHNKTKKFFKMIQKNSNNLLNAIKSMAWDLIHIRLIEREFAFKPTNKVQYAIHVLLTYDNGLKEILQINPVEQIAFYKGVPLPKFKHQFIYEIPGGKEKLLTESIRISRHKTFENLDMDQLVERLERELLSVCNKV